MILKTKLLEVEEELRLFKEQENEKDAPVEGPIPLEPDEKLYGSKRDDSKVRQFVKICLFFPTIACFAVASFCLRSFFPTSRKGSISELNTSTRSSTLPLTPRSSTVTMDSRSYLAVSSPSIQSDDSTENHLSTNQKTPKTNIPLLSPPESE
jgi:hypothetical protein